MGFLMAKTESHSYRRGSGGYREAAGDISKMMGKKKKAKKAK